MGSGCCWLVSLFWFGFFSQIQSLALIFSLFMRGRAYVFSLYMQPASEAAFTG